MDREALKEPRRVPPEQTIGWRRVESREHGIAVVVRCEDGWADGRIGRVVGPAGPPGWFTVRLDDGMKFLARPGEALTRPEPVRA